MDTRQVFIDTETTGLSANQGDRIIELAAIEVLNGEITGKRIHALLNPGNRPISLGASRVHGITNSMLIGKQTFASVASRFAQFTRGAELIMHKAAFDEGFINAEFQRAGFKTRLADLGRVTCTLEMAKKLYPGQRNNLDDLIQRAGIDLVRAKHSALQDATALAEVYRKLLSNSALVCPTTSSEVTAATAMPANGMPKTKPNSRKSVPSKRIEALMAGIQLKMDEVNYLRSLARPVIRIADVADEKWYREIQSDSKIAIQEILARKKSGNHIREGRIGPWDYTMSYDVIDEAAWYRECPVLYFATDDGGHLRLIGKSKKFLKERWRLSPMSDVHTRSKLGRRALFHTTGTPAIEDSLSAGLEKPPFTVWAVFHDELVQACNNAAGALSRILQIADESSEALVRLLEYAALQLDYGDYPLWNIEDVPMQFVERRRQQLRTAIARRP